MEDRNCLSFWFPKLLAAGLPVPKTEIVRVPEDAVPDLMLPLDGKPFGNRAKPFLEELSKAVDAIGTPCFLRTGLTSGKHSWKDTCYLSDKGRLGNHVVALINHSECAGFLGLPWNVWAVREFLPIEPKLKCTLYGSMPVCREFRCFVDGDEVKCVHPYWPKEALADGCPILNSMVGRPISRFVNILESIADNLHPTSEEEAEVRSLASQVGAAIGGEWSVDILSTSRGWHVTDMAEAEQSWHWPSCDKLSTNGSQGVDV